MEGHSKKREEVVQKLRGLNEQGVSSELEASWHC